MKSLVPIIRTIAVLYIIILSGNTASAQTYWTNHAGGQTIDEGMDVAVDAAGNTYTTGYFTTSAAFGSLSVGSAGIDDVFLCKQGVNGQYIWAVSAGGSNSDRALSIKADAAGNTYITGYFFGTANFGSQTITSAGQQDVFVAKYNTAGTCLWAVSAGGPGSDIGNGVAVDANGNVVITGEFAGTSTFGSTSLTSLSGSVDVFTAKLNSSGTFQWAKKGSAWQTDRGLDVDCDGSGNVYVTGQFSDTITFDQVHLNTMLNAVFLVKYDASGNEQWFRKIGGGAMNIANSIFIDAANGIYLTGDFQGTITFFGPSNTSLSGTYSNCIFIGKYDVQGNLTWSVSESSDSPVTSRAVSTNGNNLVIAGNFKCTFDSYSDRYATGLFNSSGYWDVFTARYNSGTGAWSIARQYGGSQDQICNGVAADAAGNPHIAGSYLKDFVTPISNNFYGYPAFASYGMTITPNPPPNNGLCSDQFYSTFGIAPSSGNSDIFIANPMDPSRAPYDYYYNTSCAQEFVGTCIVEYNGFDYNCGPDTIDGCFQTVLYAQSNTSQLAVSPNITRIGPDFTYLWSTGQNGTSITASATGNYSVVMTTADGCYSSEDTIHFILHNPPPNPYISDNVIINSNAAVTNPIVLCADSVLLFGSNFAQGDSVIWIGPSFDPGSVNNDSVIVDSTGQYTFIIFDQYGCSSSNTVDVTLDSPLLTYLPDMVCLNDTDRNDSITICENLPLFIFPFDSLSNPNENFECIDNILQILWTISPSGSINPYTDCINFAYQQATFNVTTSGWYTITGTYIRSGACGTDTLIATHSYYIDLLPAPPPINFNLVITGDTTLCPGDTAMLVVTGGYDYAWSTGSTNDTIYVTQGGSYSVSCIDTVYNSNGCFTVSSGSDAIQVTMAPQPSITLVPSNGVICPGDSVLAVASGSGTYQWQGPNGPIAGNVDSIWITSPGTYYCVVNTPEGCQLLTNSVNIQQYNTPQIIATPAAIICPGDSVTLSLYSSNGSFFAWLPPLSGSSLTQTVTSAGTYSVSVSACNIITVASITIVPTIVSAQITPLSSLTVCEGDSVLLGANAGLDSYSWSPGNDTSLTHLVYVTGSYVLTTADSGGCEAHDTISVQFQQNTLPLPSAVDTIVCRNFPFHLHASGTPAFYWYDVNGNVVGTGSNLTFASGLPADSTFFVLSSDGVCRTSLIPVNVTVEECPPLTPNVFSPNGDGTNDGFSLYEPEALNIRVQIYDRWGVLVYEYTDVYGFWDGTYMVNGKMCSDGVYYWIADIGYFNGNQQKSGFVHLLTH
jgi:gliding motility-associated-like protein